MAFDEKCLDEILEKYREDLDTPRFKNKKKGKKEKPNITWWEKEKYKWKAVKTFQDKWNVEAANFKEMLKDALHDTDNLLESRGILAKSALIDTFAGKAPEETRAMFRDLFDESKDFIDRVETFKKKSEQLHDKYGHENWSNHQGENAITTYLWLRYPDRYYIYKQSVAAALAQKLGYGYDFPKGAHEENLRQFFDFYNEICARVKADKKLTDSIKSHLAGEDTCYQDPEYKTLVTDLGVYVKSGDVPPTPPPPPPPPGPKKYTPDPKKYTREDFLREVFMTGDQYDKLKAVLEQKKNIILKGVPGVGKTYAAKRLAYSMMGKKDDNRIKLIQFHQNYSYEDFMQGYKPKEGGGFKLEPGVFYEFCNYAADHPQEGDFFFIIDEINRGNMSKIFGELLMMIENTYRGEKVILAYDKKPFSIPANLYIIGMMNTADRSIAMLDYALRRRFAHFELEPAFNTSEFKAWLKYTGNDGNERLKELIKRIKALNRRLAKNLGKGFRIGHSYFCEQKTYSEDDLNLIVDYEIIPAIEEYWFDEQKKVALWSAILRMERPLADADKDEYIDDEDIDDEEEEEDEDTKENGDN